MFKWFVITIIVVGSLLTVLIYIDSSNQAEVQIIAEHDHGIQLFDESMEYETESNGQSKSQYAEPELSMNIPEPQFYGDFHSTDLNDSEQILNRIEEIEVILTSEEYTGDRVPFYGELKLLYLQLGRDDGAAEASRHIAMELDDADDWWNAAVLFYRWALAQESEDHFYYYLQRSEDAFSNAVSINPGAPILTDYAIILQALQKSEDAMAQIEKAIALDESYSRAHLYGGLILHEKGKKDKSISYISRSLELAVDEDETRFIRNILAEASIEI